MRSETRARRCSASRRLPRPRAPRRLRSPPSTPTGLMLGLEDGPAHCGVRRAAGCRPRARRRTRDAVPPWSCPATAEARRAPTSPASPPTAINDQRDATPILIARVPPGTAALSIRCPRCEPDARVLARRCSAPRRGAAGVRPPRRAAGRQRAYVHRGDLDQLSEDMRAGRGGDDDGGGAHIDGTAAGAARDVRAMVNASRSGDTYRSSRAAEENGAGVARPEA